MSDDRDRPLDPPSHAPAQPLPPRYRSDDPRAVEQDIQERRIAEEKAHYERGFPVAGHDFRREHDRERSR